MKVKELFEVLKGKEDYDIIINNNLYGDDFELEINDNVKEINFLIEEDEYYNDDDEEEYYYEYEMEQYLYNFDKDDLIKLINELNIKLVNIDNLSKDDLIEKITDLENEDTIMEICEELFSYSYEDFVADNEWRHSNYESKDIDDWTVDDHLAAWYDHMMEK